MFPRSVLPVHTHWPRRQAAECGAGTPGDQKAAFSTYFVEFFFVFPRTNRTVHEGDVRLENLLLVHEHGAIADPDLISDWDQFIRIAN